MFFDEDESVHLKAYLIKELEPICEANPGALADFVIALLKHDQPQDELLEFCKDQLADFLTDAAGFVHRLFETLHLKSYIALDSHSHSRSSSRFVEEKHELYERRRDDRHDVERYQHEPRRYESRDSRDSRDRFENRRDDYRDRYDSRDDRLDRHDRVSRDSRDRRDRFAPYKREDREERNGLGAAIPRAMRMGRCFEYDEKGSCPRGDECHFVAFHSPITDAPPMEPKTNPRMQRAFPGQHNDTLVIENIPQEYYNPNSIKDYFSKFGTIVEITMDPSAPKCLIKYSSYQEAMSAHKSPESVFGNRFVKIFFARKDLVEESKVQTAQQEALAKQHREREQVIVQQQKQNILNAEKRKYEKNKQLLEIQEVMIHKQIANQKSILELLEDPSKTLSDQATAELRSSLSSLQEQTKVMMDKMSVLKASIPTLPEQSSTTSMEVEMSEADLVLEQQLNALKAQAALVGIDPNAELNGHAPSYRGRGNYRGAFRGRGYASKVLDNRPAKFFVAHIPSESIERVQGHYAAIPGCVSVELDGQRSMLQVSFENRRLAEGAYSNMPKLAELNQMNVSWTLE